MGQQQSNDVSGSSPSTPSAAKRSAAGSEAVKGVSGEPHNSLSHGRDGSQKRKAHGKAAPPSTASPSSTLVSSSAASTSTTTTHATATAISASPKRIHTHSHGNARPRSITTGTPQRAALDAASISHFHFDAPHDRFSPISNTNTMGQSDSKFSAPHPPSRASTLPVHPAHKASPTSEPPDQQPDQLKAESLSNPPPASPSARPVDVPQPTASTTTTDGPADADKDDKEDDYIPTGHIEPSSYTTPAANYSRPPRLPLPIEEEVHTPGSPISTPQDVTAGVKDVETSALDQADVEGAIPRKASVLSSTTIDDDEVDDNEAFANEAQWGEIRVPTTLDWHGGGDKIFVTGTFCNWEKKVKLHRNKDKSGFSATVNLRPGTHHIKFLVDGEMVTSNELPTTVDWTNILVNYIEIVAPLPAGAQGEKQAPAPAAPMPIPGAAITAGQATGTDEPAARPPRDAEARAAETDADLPISPQEPVGPKGEHQASLSAQTPTPGPTAPPATQKPLPQPESKPAAAPPKQILPRPRYTNEIPEFLVDLDNYNNPEDDRFQRAQRAVSTLPTPPSLPMFLSKSILNGATPHKDDASVLIMPNHTVLNHLATSSIKGGVLATSGTTRYKRKFLTTIMYKPTSDDG